DYANINKDFKYISLRYFNPIGAHPSGLIGELPIGTPNNLIPYITQTAAGVREELKVFGDDYPTPDGTAMRDYIDVVDLANAHVKSIDRIFTNANLSAFEAFNLGSGEGISVKEVIETFERENNVQIHWSYAPRREGDIPLIYADTKKAKKELGWSTTTPLAHSLKNAWRWEKMYRDKHAL
ncbi:MAG: GDP-mannose 4,6-dehydratase, partial [Perlabentimonas sp.]